MRKYTVKVNQPTLSLLMRQFWSDQINKTGTCKPNLEEGLTGGYKKRQYQIQQYCPEQLKQSHTNPQFIFVCLNARPFSTDKTRKSEFRGWNSSLLLLLTRYWTPELFKHNINTACLVPLTSLACLKITHDTLWHSCSQVYSPDIALKTPPPSSPSLPKFAF